MNSKDIYIYRLQIPINVDSQNIEFIDCRFIGTKAHLLASLTATLHFCYAEVCKQQHCNFWRCHSIGKQSHMMVNRRIKMRWLISNNYCQHFGSAIFMINDKNYKVDFNPSRCYQLLPTVLTFMLTWDWCYIVMVVTYTTSQCQKKCNHKIVILMDLDPSLSFN